MHSHHPQRHLERPGFHRTYYREDLSVWDRLQQPSITIPLLLLLITILYQSYQSRHSPRLSYTRHPGELLWDFIIAVTPAKLLFALDAWLHPPMFPVPKTSIPARESSYAAKSDALRRILGMDRPGSIINSVAHASRRSLSTLSGRSPIIKRNVQQPPGLGNYDNSCFQNSILQGLASLASLPAYLQRALEHAAATGTSQSSSASTLRDLISQLTDPNNNGTTLWTPKKLKSLDTWEQQDAQEYFSKILDEIDKEVTKAARERNKAPGLEIASVRDDSEGSQHSDDSGYHSQSVSPKPSSDGRLLGNPLEGLVAQRVACTQCDYSEGLSMIPFNCLTLTLRTDGMPHDLYERLDAYMDLEKISGVECAKCSLLKVQKLLQLIIERGRSVGASEEMLREPLARLEAVQLALEDDDFEEKTLHDKCKIAPPHRVSTTKTKQVVIARPPQSLAIHVNRSVFDERTGHMFKNLAPVQFPRTLDLGPWCLGSAGGSMTTQGNPGAGGSQHLLDPETGDGEQWFSDPRRSMIAGDLGISKITGPIYELRAVITHQGRHENGHYICYRKQPSPPTKLADTYDKSNDHKEAEASGLDDRSSTFSDAKTLIGTEQPDGADRKGQEQDERDGEDPSQKWWRLSDETVWEVSEDHVLAQGGVFMLFYDCVEPNSVLVSDVLADEEKLLGLSAATVESDDVPSTLNGTPAPPETAPDGVQLQKLAEASPENPHVDDLGLSTAMASGEPAGDIRVAEGTRAFSHLYPLLADDEPIDPTIPLRRPNS